MAKRQRDYAAEYASRKALRNLRIDNEEYSKDKSWRVAGQYLPEFTAKEARAYHAAYVKDDNYKHVRDSNSGNVAALRYFMVDLMGYLTPEEFDARYGKQAG